MRERGAEVVDGLSCDSEVEVQGCSGFVGFRATHGGYGGSYRRSVSRERHLEAYVLVGLAGVPFHGSITQRQLRVDGSYWSVPWKQYLGAIHVSMDPTTVRCTGATLVGDSLFVFYSQYQIITYDVA